MQIRPSEPFAGSHRQVKLRPRLSYLVVEQSFPTPIPDVGLEPASDCDHEYFFEALLDGQWVPCAVWRMDYRSDWSAYGPRQVFEHLGLL